MNIWHSPRVVPLVGRLARRQAEDLRRIKVAKRARDAYAAKYPPHQFDGSGDD